MDDLNNSDPTWEVRLGILRAVAEATGAQLPDLSQGLPEAIERTEAELASYGLPRFSLAECRTYMRLKICGECHNECMDFHGDKIYYLRADIGDVLDIMTRTLNTDGEIFRAFIRHPYFNPNVHRGYTPPEVYMLLGIPLLEAECIQEHLNRGEMVMSTEDAFMFILAAERMRPHRDRYIEGVIEKIHGLVHRCMWDILVEKVGMGVAMRVMTHLVDGFLGEMRDNVMQEYRERAAEHRDISEMVDWLVVERNTDRDTVTRMVENYRREQVEWVYDVVDDSVYRHFMEGLEDVFSLDRFANLRNPDRVLMEMLKESEAHWLRRRDCERRLRDLREAELALQRMRDVEEG